MTEKKRVINLVTKVTGAPELKKTEASLRRIEKATKQANKSLNTMAKSAKTTATNMKALNATIAAYASARVIGAMIRATAEQERVVTQLEAALKSTGGAAGKTSEELQDLASSLQAVTTYGDEAIIGAQSLLLTFKNIQGATFDRTLESLLDMSTAMGQDLKTSAIQLGKALNDPVKGLSALARVGITFDKSQEDIIKTMAKTNRVAEAQALILEELESQFGGSAAAAAETFGGAIKQLGNSWGDLLEADPKNLNGVVESINDLNDVITNPAFKDSMQDFVAGLLGAAGAAAGAASTAIRWIQDMARAIAAAANGPAIDDLERINAELQEIEDKLQNRGRMEPFWVKQLEAQRDNLLSMKSLYEDLQKPLTITIPSGVPQGGIPGAGGESDADRRIRENDFKQAQEDFKNYEYALEQAAIAEEKLAQKRAESQTLAVKATELFSSSFDTMLDGVLQGTQSVADGFKDMAKVIIAELLRIAAIKSIAGLFDPGSAIGTSLMSSIGLANGGVVSNSKVTPFANGGVVSSPTLFPMANGAGLMGEAGPEAIVPLNRGPGGKLGVGASPVNVTVNNMASGVEVRTRQTDGGLTLDVVMAQVAGAVRQGGNDLTSAMESTYSIGRGGAAY